MVVDWHHRFSLSSHWDREAGRYTISLTNQSADAIRDFQLGVSGPLRLGTGAVVTGGQVIVELATYYEFAPPSGYELDAGATWTLAIENLSFPLRHWTDGAVTGFVVLADGTVANAATTPPSSPEAGAYPVGTMHLSGKTSTRLSIVPWPNQVTAAGRRSAPDGLAPSGDEPEARAAAAHFSELTTLLFPGEGLCRTESEGGLPVTLSVESQMAPSAYRIVFSQLGAKVEGRGATELLYGLITLGQIARGARHDRGAFDFPVSGEIVDAPTHGFRGCLLDVARRYYSPAELGRFAGLLAWNKLNRLHLHLSDDEAWRVEIAAYPRLAEIGGWRGYGLALPPLLGTGPERTGGVYSKADIAALVARAERFGVDIIPEIDIPGHCYALLQAIPALADPGENGPYASVQAFPNNCLNPAVPAVDGILETILGELAAMFPSPWFHIGADEVPAGAWSSSPLANAMRQQLGVTGAAPLQAHLLRRVQALLGRLGKKTAGWEEAAHGGGISATDCYLVGWTKPEASRELAAAGYDVVVAPGQAYYLDMANSPDWHEPGAGWAGWSSPQTAYAFTPGEGWTDAERRRLIGVQGCIWSEPMTDRAVFDRLVFPRLSAIAETGWTRPGQKDFARFAAASRFLPNLYGRFEGAA